MLEAQLHGNGDIMITSIAPLHLTKKRHIAFLSNNRCLIKLAECKAFAIILKKNNLLNSKIATLVVKDPYFFMLN